MLTFFNSKTPESMTRLVFFIFALGVLVWETYAVFGKTTVPNLLEILAFMTATLGWKQYTEVKSGSSVTSTQAVLPSNQPNP